MIKKGVLIICAKSKKHRNVMIFICKKPNHSVRVFFHRSRNTLKDLKKTTHEFFLRLFLAN
ncbi:hypothetical protein SM39_2533A [Serratia marcescens SM39]|uniref:Uncharacterized protein n=1 Tax=Serratia marcescens SM39 TaxID=1334564 RepID=A0AAT9F166_SERMA|nr:hypothetical protein SM39_2533A [Serratia marcescens SM39]